VWELENTKQTKKTIVEGLQMHNSAGRFNLIKIITMAVVLGFMAFSMLAGGPGMISTFF
jgi:hypothetical protein